MDDADAVIVAVGDVERSVRRDDAPVRAIHAGLGRDAVFLPLAAAGDGRHLQRLRIDLADAMVLAIDDVDVARGVAADALWPVEDGVLGGAIVSFVSAFAGAGDGGDRSL